LAGQWEWGRREDQLLIAAALFVVGFMLSRRARILVLAPVATLVSVCLLTIWLVYDELDWLKGAILFGYIFALNTGYLVGAATRYSRSKY
jgi:hypothetical protein